MTNLQSVLAEFLEDNDNHKYNCAAWDEGKNCCLESDNFKSFLTKALSDLARELSEAVPELKSGQDCKDTSPGSTTYKCKGEVRCWDKCDGWNAARSALLEKIASLGVKIE